MRIGVAVSAAVAAAALSPAAWARDYHVVSASRDQITVIDPDRIEVRTNGHRIAWSAAIRREAMPHPRGQMNYAVLQSQFDCIGQRQRVVATAFYERDGSVLQTVEFPQAAWQPVYPESQGESIYRFVCATPSVRLSLGDPMPGLTLRQVVSSIFEGYWPAR